MTKTSRPENAGASAVAAPLALVGVVAIEPVREGTALQEIEHLVTPGRPALANDVQERHPRPCNPGPAPEDLADDGIEPLLRIAPRLQQIRIDLAEHQGAAQRRIGGTVTVADEHAARGSRAEIVHARQQSETRQLA